jgi:hypothetical protein
MRHHVTVAGGMNRRSDWGSMAQRVAAAPKPAPAENATATPVNSPPQPPAALKHCWVVDPHGRLPALLLEWRRTDAGFQGRVVRPVEDPDLGWIVVEEWVPAALLQPL